MSSLRDVEMKLPPGFRFHPADDELICDYLMRRVAGLAHRFPFLIEVDLNKCEPWDIPESACVGGKEWYFYSQRDRKYATGLRTNRATVSGYWKATGKDRPVIRKGTLVGMRKTLVFYQGRAPKGRKSDWIMHEFRIEGSHGASPKAASPLKEDWVLCRVFYKDRSEGYAAAAAEGKQESGNGYPRHATTPSLSSLPPPLTEPTYLTAFEQTLMACSNDHLYHEQVPCLSIFTTNQAIDAFSEVFPDKLVQGVLPDLGSYDLPSLNDPSSSSSCDKNAIKAVSNRFSKAETANDIKDSPSFGEGSSDSYLSEAGLSTMWNQFS